MCLMILDKKKSTQRNEGKSHSHVAFSLLPIRCGVQPTCQKKTPGGLVLLVAAGDIIGLQSERRRSKPSHQWSNDTVDGSEIPFPTTVWMWL